MANILPVRYTPYNLIEISVDLVGLQLQANYSLNQQITWLFIQLSVDLFFWLLVMYSDSWVVEMVPKAIRFRTCSPASYYYLILLDGQWPSFKHQRSQYPHQTYGWVKATLFYAWRVCGDDFLLRDIECERKSSKESAYQGVQLDTPALIPSP